MNKKNIFNLTTRPNKRLFFKSKDKNDWKFGDIVSSDPRQYSNCKYAILGCPQDIGVKRNNGRVGAANAPDKIREMFYRLNAPTIFNAGELFDIGNIRIAQSLEMTHDLHKKIVSQLLLDGKRLIVLGGGNDISYPDCKALSQCSKSVLAFNIDSHFDVRENKQRNSGTPYRQLLEEQLVMPWGFYEVASQEFANSEFYRNYLKSKKVTVLSLEQIRRSGIDITIKDILNKDKSQSIFWGFDMDSVRASDAPGVSASYPSGLTAEEILSMASIAGSDKRSRVFEISEVNPKFDIDDRTSKLAALLMFHFLKANLK